jgi:hypothetical protein
MTDNKAPVKTGFFMKGSSIPSIHAFSVILTFYGTRRSIKSLVECLAKGGKEFYKSKVENGHFFRSLLPKCNKIYLQNFGKDCMKWLDADLAFLKQTKPFLGARLSIEITEHFNPNVTTLFEKLDSMRIATKILRSHCEGK